MLLLIEDSELEAYPSLYTDRPAVIPSLTVGADLPLSVGRLKRVRLPYDSKVFEPQSLTGWTMRAALGGGFQLPVAGYWPITFTAADSSTESSGWIIPANPAAEDIANALNDLASVAAIGGVSVQGADGFFEITFDAVGVRNLLTANAARLVPLSLLNFARAVTGDSSTQEVQTLRILQNTGALVSLAVDTVSTTISQADVVVGDATHNAKIRITLPIDRYGGTWSLTKGATVVNNLGFNDNEAQLQAALQTALGSGNVLVSQYDSDNFDLTFAGSLGLTATTITLDGSALSVPTTMSGDLDTSSAGIDLLFQEAEQVIARFEIEGAPSGGSTRKLFQADVQLNRPVLTAASAAPNTAQSIEDYSGTSADLSPTAATQTLTLAPGKRFLQWFQKITVLAGSGAYTVSVALTRANAIEGAIYRVQVVMPASANPTVKFYDGTVLLANLLDTLPGDSSNAWTYNFEARFAGGQYRYYRSGFQT